MGGRECVLVIDIGSSSTRCVAFGMDCRPLDGSLMQDKSLFLSSDATMDAAEVSTKTEGVVTRCLSWCQAHGYTSVRALGIDSFALSLLGVDSSGAECTPCYTYADARPDEYAQRLRHSIPQLREKRVERFVVVVNGEPSACTKLASFLSLPPEVELLSDPSGEAGRRFGVSRGWRPDDAGLNPYLKLYLMLFGIGYP